MRSHSTPESALNLEITKLAIVETAVSLALYIGAGFYLGTFQYLTLAVLVAPLMLLRTERSTDWGLRVYARFSDAVIKEAEGVRFVFMTVVIGLVGMCIRVVATSYCTVQRPLWTLRQIPENWLRQTLCTDFFHPPEIVPGEVLKDPKGLTFPIFPDMYALVPRTYADIFRLPVRRR